MNAPVPSAPDTGTSSHCDVAIVGAGPAGDQADLAFRGQAAQEDGDVTAGKGLGHGKRGSEARIALF